MKKIFRFTYKLFFVFIALTVLWVLAYKWIDIPGTPLMGIRTYQHEHNIAIKHQWVSLDNISKNLQLAVICSEDQKFMEHQGFDTQSIAKVIKRRSDGKKLRGASTISQQTAKNVFLWPQRSWIRKGLESYFTFLIEICWSKERILEVYLNSIEMGDHIYGAEAASVFWFYKSAKDLNKEEAAAIAAILPNPREYIAAPPSVYIQKRIKWIITQMRNYGRLSLEE